MSAAELAEDYGITTIFLTGVNGQLGSALRRKWSQDEYQSKFCVVASHHDTLDISDRDAVSVALDQFCPDIVVNCAGFNRTCASQQDRVNCWKVNSLGVRNLAEACLKRKAFLVQLSCDSVFGADDNRYTMLSDINRLAGLGFCVDSLDCRYTENSLCGPADFNGACKLSGEAFIHQLKASNFDFNYWIIRTGYVFEYPWRASTNFLYAIANMLKSSKKEIPMPVDVLFNLCYAPEAADAISWMIENRTVMHAEKAVGKWAKASCISPGVYHLANPGGTSWYQVARQLAVFLGCNPERIKPVSVSTYKSVYRGDMPPVSGLGRYRILSTDKYESLDAPRFSVWKDVLDDWCVAYSGQAVSVA